MRLILATDVLLLGEQHDQPLHHPLRAGWLKAWAAAGAADSAPLPAGAAASGEAGTPVVLPGNRASGGGAPAGPGAAGDAQSRASGRDGSRPVIVFEHLDREHDQALRSAQGRHPAGPAGVWLAAARLDERAWDEALYRPLFAAAFEVAQAGRARWVAGNFSRESARAWMRAQMQGKAADDTIDPALRALRDRARWDDGAGQALLAAVREGHCNALPDEALGPMVAMQRVRDAALAQPLQHAVHTGGRALLLAGNGHVDRRFGVPRYLPAQAGKVLVVGLENLPAAYRAAANSVAANGAVANSQPDAGNLPDAGNRKGRGEVVQGPEAGRHAGPPAGDDALSRLVGEGRAARLRAAYDVVVLTPPSAEPQDHCAAFRTNQKAAGPSGIR